MTEKMQNDGLNVFEKFFGMLFVAYVSTVGFLSDLARVPVKDPDQEG